MFTYRRPKLTQFRRSASVQIEIKLGQIIIIRDLRITFNVDKYDDKTPNTADIEIYNLSQNTRDKLKDLESLLILNAGYLDGDGEELLFTGNITNISHTFPSPDVITKINANDGKKSLGTAKTTINRTGGTSAKRILEDVLNTFPLANNLRTIQVNDKNYQNGFSFAGMSKDALTKITQFLELSWSIQNNEIRIVPFDGDDNTKVVSLSPQTGMIGSPERLVAETRKSTSKSKSVKPGWKIESLLSPKINPVGKIVLSSREIPENTVFTVNTVTHRGDTDGSEWTTVTEVREK